jgi:hypothetical protein
MAFFHSPAAQVKDIKFLTIWLVVFYPYAKPLNNFAVFQRVDFARFSLAVLDFLDLRHLKFLS